MQAGILVDPLVLSRVAGGRSRNHCPVTAVNGGGGRNRTGVHGFAVRCMATLPPRRAVDDTADRPHKHLAGRWFVKKMGKPFRLPRLHRGAGNESRTRDLNLGKVALYQLSYSRTVRFDYSLFDRRSERRRPT